MSATTVPRPVTETREPCNVAACTKIGLPRSIEVSSSCSTAASSDDEDLAKHVGKSRFIRSTSASSLASFFASSDDEGCRLRFQPNGDSVDGDSFESPFERPWRQRRSNRQTVATAFMAKLSSPAQSPAVSAAKSDPSSAIKLSSRGYTAAVGSSGKDQLIVQDPSTGNYELQPEMPSIPEPVSLGGQLVNVSDDEEMTLSLDMSENDGDVGFEVWVDSPIEAAWCLENAAAKAGLNAQWRDSCRTAYVRRSWEDFVAITQPGCNGNGPSCSLREAYEWLGLPPEGPDDATHLDSAFRQKSVIYHPDRGGSQEDFNALVLSKKTVQRALVERTQQTSGLSPMVGTAGKLH